MKRSSIRWVVLIGVLGLLAAGALARSRRARDPQWLVARLTDDRVPLKYQIMDAMQMMLTGSPMPVTPTNDSLAWGRLVALGDASVPALEVGLLSTTEPSPRVAIAHALADIDTDADHAALMRGIAQGDMIRVFPIQDALTGPPITERKLAALVEGSLENGDPQVQRSAVLLLREEPGPETDAALKMMLADERVTPTARASAQRPRR